MDWKILVISMLAVAIAISVFLEWMKLTAKKQKKMLPTFVLIFIPAFLSVGLSWVVWSALELPGAIQIVVLYALLVFVTQYYLSMEILKRIGKPVTKFFMRLMGMNKDEIEEVFSE